jgi:tRNA pseudouridine55 synthase
MGIDGILNVNKPLGYSSFKVVSQIRRMTGEKRVGHAGTLDPAATGVLPICLGQATRVSEYFLSHTKKYVALIELGITTDTFDSQGTITSRKDAIPVTLSLVHQALEDFKGTIFQVPPSYSAVKIKGKPAYKMAREGIEVSIKPREVRIESIEIISFENSCIELKIECSKGTYIRSIANDLGEKLGCGAYLKNLARTVYGPFKIANAVSLEDIGNACNSGQIAKILYPVDSPLAGLERQDIDEKTSHDIVHGHDVILYPPSLEQNLLCRAYYSGKIFAIMKFLPAQGKWHPEKVFLPEII